MTIRNLGPMLAPKSVAFVGASPRPGSVGFVVARNLLDGGFKGELYFINSKHSEVLGRQCYPDVAALPQAPDLAVIATPPASVPGLIREFGEKGTRAATVITAGMSVLRQEMLDAARPYCLRIQGPNCLGLMLPNSSVNASFCHRPAPVGDLAFISQSGALVTSVVDWAASRNIGFSHVISLGDMADIDFGDLLDYLAGDTKSRAILLYMEALTNAPKFISAARRAARVKPVILVKSGRHEAGARAAMSHTGALAGSDAAYDAAFRRTGLLRVKTLPDLFAAAEILSRRPHLTGERLTILTNGGGVGVLAADELQDQGGTLAALSPETLARLDAVLPKAWSRGNPVDIIGDGGPERYRAALEALMEDKESSAILVMQCPTALASSIDNAKAVTGVAQDKAGHGGTSKILLTCWLGDDAARESRALFASNGIPAFETPSDSVTGFMQIVRHARAQIELMQAPSTAAVSGDVSPDAAAALIAEALKAGRTVLTSVEAKQILKAAGINVALSLVATDASKVHDTAAAILREHAACVVKILSQDISHKSDVGGVRLGIESAPAAELAAQEMMVRVAKLKPGARIEGFIIEPMVRRPNAQEVIIGMSEDATFGPVVLFGAGGIAVEVMADRALALPPLDSILAKQMIKETRIYRLLAGYRDRPAANLEALSDALVKVSRLVVHHPEIRELDINPLLADENGVIALDARIRIADAKAVPRRPLAIKPYPEEWETVIDVTGAGAADMRPIRPDDEFRYEAFFAKISPGDVRLRFFTPRVDLSQRFVARLTQIDYAREMAFVAISKTTDDLLGVVRLVLDPDLERGEFGLLVRSDMQGLGLGWALMQHLIRYGQHEGIAQITGSVLAENTTMISMARQLGFEVKPDAEDQSVFQVTLTL